MIEQSAIRMTNFAILFVNSNTNVSNKRVQVIVILNEVIMECNVQFSTVKPVQFRLDVFNFLIYHLQMLEDIH